MSISRQLLWNPGNGFNRDLRQVFDRFTHNGATEQPNVETSQWAPRVDIREEDKRFVIFADIPGVDPKDIEVNMDKGILTIKGNRALESSAETGQFSRVERSSGSFFRRFALPDSADAENINAAGKHGVLEISIPKKPETTPRRITINA